MREARRTEGLVLLAIVAGAALLRLRLLDVPLERDEGEYAYIAQLILRGEAPYVAANSMKLPGVFYAYAAILRLLGETPAAIHGALIAVNAVSIALVDRLGRRLFGVVAGLVAAAVFAVLSVGMGVLGFTANAEHFVLVPMLAGVCLLAGLSDADRIGDARALGRVAAAGMLFGLAYVIKQHAFAFLLFGGLWLAARAVRAGRAEWRRSAAACVVFAAAAALPFAATCALMYGLGAFEPFWFWTVTYAREYATLNSLELALGELPEVLGWLLGTSWPLWALGALGLSALWWDERMRRQRTFALLFAACSFLAVMPGLRFSVHYFVLALPAVSVLAGAGVAALSRRAPAHWRAVSAVALPAVAAASCLAMERAYLFTLPPVAVARAAFGLNPFPEAVEIARQLRRLAAPGDRVAVIGSEPEIYFYSGLRAATPFIYAYPLMEPHPFAEQMQRDMIAGLEREKPRFLVMVNVDKSWSRRPESSTLLFDWSARTVNDDYQAIGLADIVRGEGTTYVWGEEARTAVPRSRTHVVVFERRTAS